MSTPEKKDAAEQTTEGGESKLSLNKDTVRDLEAAGEQQVQGGAAAENYTDLCVSRLCITIRP